tara:strand:- start:228 stop:851 length:624 start_codon:yes stop_codon:yes gene_type:complete
MIHNQTDTELTSNLKNDVEAEASLKELVNRHSGIFLDIVNNYVPNNSPTCHKQDIIDDLEYYIYNAGLKYDQTRGAKFSTFLGNEAKWLCLNQHHKNKKYLLAASPESQFALESNAEEEKTTEHSPHVNEALLCKIFEIIDKHPDARVRRIFKLRYVDPEFNKLTPWQKVGKELKMSIQGCINIHNSAIKIIRKTLKENELDSRYSY